MCFLSLRCFAFHFVFLLHLFALWLRRHEGVLGPKQPASYTTRISLTFLGQLCGIAIVWNYNCVELQLCRITEMEK